MWPARVRTPPCCSVVMERGGRVAIGRRGERRGGWERELPTTGHHGCVRAVNGHRPPSCLEKGGLTADGTWCRLACWLTRWVLYQPLDCTGTHLARLPRLLDFHKPSPGQWLKRAGLPVLLLVGPGRGVHQRFVLLCWTLRPYPTPSTVASQTVAPLPTPDCQD